MFSNENNAGNPPDIYRAIQFFHSQILPSQFYGMSFTLLVSNIYLEGVWA